MLVANKFQTGFDQPLLCAMYVDKRLSGVNAVQTLSRLNRVATGKDKTYILDFVNDPEEIRESFLPYFQTAQLTDIADRNIVLELERKLNIAGIYDEDDVKRVSDLVVTAVKGKGNNALTAALSKPRDTFKSLLKSARESKDGAELDRLETFRKDVGSFVKAYGFLSQVYDYADTDLERLSLFLRQLEKVIADSAPESYIDLSELEIIRYQITEQANQSLLMDDTGSIAPFSALGGHEVRDPKLVLLEEAIARVNEMVDFSDDSAVSGKIVVDSVNQKLLENEKIVAQAKANSEEQFIGSADLSEAIIRALIGLKRDADDASSQILSSSAKQDDFMKVIGRAIYALVNS
jgi:type I restriction enzyme R subunit